jgi:hypothetical protein
MTTVNAFSRYIGVDYSGARAPTDSLPGLRVYLTDDRAPPREITPPPSPRKYWTRKGLAEWLVERLAEGGLTGRRRSVVATNSPGARERRASLTLSPASAS